MDKEEIKEIIDYIFEKSQEFLTGNLKQIGDTFGHELFLSLNKVFEKTEFYKP